MIEADNVTEALKEWKEAFKAVCLLSLKSSNKLECFSNKMNTLVIGWVESNLNPKENKEYYLDSIAASFKDANVPIERYESVLTDAKAHEFFLELFELS